MTLEETSITVSEDIGDSEVCVTLTGGELGIDITLLLSTDDLTADGTLVAIIFIHDTWKN